MDVAQALLEAGGIASTSVLLSVVTRGQLDAAVEAGSVVGLRRGHYSLPGIDADRSAVVALSGAACLLSAARHWEWKVKLPPDHPQVVVPRGRKVAPRRRKGIDLRWGEVTAEELAEGVTSKVRTVLDCARKLPFDAALAVVDSALRDGVTKTELLLACQRLPRQGRSRALRVVELGDGRAANPFESVLRAIINDVVGADFEPQVWIGNIGRADLVDRRRRIVVEGDSFEFHADAEALKRDIVRYNSFLGEGHLVLRFGWQHAMFDQDYVRETVRAAISPQGRSVRWCPRCAAA